MKSLFLSIIFVITCSGAFAQTEATAVQTEQTAASAIHYGYLSCDSALHALPAYAIAMKNLNDLKAKYAAEMKRVEDEFNYKYELFLEQQSDFAPSIRQKRQAELQELMEKNTAFKAESQRLLAKAEKEALTPLKKTVSAAITLIGQQRHLAFIVNTDGGSLPYVDTTMGEDITAEVIKYASLKNK